MGEYMKIKVDGVTYSLHRYVWEQVYGPVPDGYLVHHVNHDKLDNRIENLMLMTHVEHSAHHNDLHPRERLCFACGERYEPPAKHRGRSRTCSPDCFRDLMRIQRTAVNGQRKITQAQREVIRARVAAGERRADLATEYGVAKSTMTRICVGIA
jgi:HNH endonuclease